MVERFEQGSGRQHLDPGGGELEREGKGRQCAGRWGHVLGVVFGDGEVGPHLAGAFREQVTAGSAPTPSRSSRAVVCREVCLAIVVDDVRGVARGLWSHLGPEVRWSAPAHTRPLLSN